MGMTIEGCIHKLDFSIKAYQKLIDEHVSDGQVVGTGVRGEWSANTPLNEAYQSYIDAYKMAKDIVRKYQLIEQIVHAYVIDNPREPMFDTEDYMESIKEVVNRNEDCIHKLDFSIWIPVSERLPAKEEYIANNGLFIVSDGNRTYAEYFDVYNSMKYFGEPTMNGFRVDRCVIAWMPLPKPYEPQESEDKEWEQYEMK